MPAASATVSGTRRAVAGVVALAWPTLGFGLIDLTVMPDEGAGRADPYLLALGWGLIFTLLVPLPLLAWAARPQRWSGPQLLAIAAALLVAAALAGAGGQVVVGLVVLASGAGVTTWRRTSRLHRPAPGGARHWPLAAIAVIGAVGGAAYAWRMLDAARSGAPDDVTLGMRHLPMMAAFGLAVPASAAVAVIALPGRLPDRCLAAAPATVCAVWFGVASLRHADVVGGLGGAGGALAVAWGVALVAGLALASPARRSAAPEAAPDPR